MKKAIVAALLSAVVALGGGALKAGATYGANLVHDQLAAQHIVVPPAEALEDTPGMLAFAGQQVVNGEQARAYANEFIWVHMQGIADGKTYAEVSYAAMQDPENEELAGQKQALFMGNALRSMLLNAYGWDFVARIAADAANVLFGLALALLAFAARTAVEARRRS